MEVRPQPVRRQVEQAGEFAHPLGRDALPLGDGGGRDAEAGGDPGDGTAAGEDVFEALVAHGEELTEIKLTDKIPFQLNIFGEL